MSWRIVAISNPAKLDYKMDYLIIRNNDEIRKIHISEIYLLLIETTAVSLTSYLICELNKRKIDIIFCDEKRCPSGRITPFYGSHDTSLKIRNQIKWKEDTKAFIWLDIVKTKITGQATVLNAFEKSEANLLYSYIPEIQPADSTNREGHAAKVYFNSLFGMSFSRSNSDLINSALNYGYSIILSLFAREIASNGYITQLGIFHDNMFNQFNLACDLMEPFRPFIDYTVAKMTFYEFAHNEKMELVQTLNNSVIIDDRVQYMNNAIKIYTKSILDALNENDLSLIRFPKYELQIYENDSII